MSDKIKLIKDSKQTNIPLVCLTAYTTSMAKTLSPHCDLILVGDSVGMVVYGMENTLSVTLDMMINHGRAVMRAIPNSCVVVDMPYGTYELDKDIALKNAKHIIAETQCDAVKLEGGADMADIISHLVNNKISVVGHIGLQPQSVEIEGGYKIKGKTDDDCTRLINDAKAIEKAGVFAIVIEGTIEPVAHQITQMVNVPTIGIGASVHCDGQILVTEDMLGLLYGHTPKFVKKYAQLNSDINHHIEQYAQDVKNRSFPCDQYVYTVKK